MCDDRSNPGSPHFSFSLINQTESWDLTFAKCQLESISLCFVFFRSSYSRPCHPPPCTAHRSHFSFLFLFCSFPKTSMDDPVLEFKAQYNFIFSKLCGCWFLDPSSTVIIWSSLTERRRDQMIKDRFQHPPFWGGSFFIFLYFCEIPCLIYLCSVSDIFIFSELLNLYLVIFWWENMFCCVLMHGLSLWASLCTLNIVIKGQMLYMNMENQAFWWKNS